MKVLTDVDLRHDPHVQWVQKEETVQVSFAQQPGMLISLEGPNHYQQGDALISAQTGEQWVVSRSRFLEKYVAIEGTQSGENGRYQNQPIAILAKQMSVAFQIRRSPQSPDTLTGKSGDWLMQYAPDDYGIVKATRFQQVYRILKK